MNKPLVLLCTFILMFAIVDHNYLARSGAGRYEDYKTTVNFPRELFFTFNEESFIMFLEEWGGIVSEPHEDSAAFWRIYPENAGISYL